MPADAKRICTLYKELETRRLTRESWWQFVADYVLPRKAFISRKGYSAGGENERKLFDNTASDACDTLAAGHMRYITPASTMWLKYEAPEELKKFPEVVRFYDNAGRKALSILGQSNFYTAKRESYLDRSAFGISAMSVFPSKKGNVIYFQNHEVGSYVIDEDEEGIVDTFMARKEWSIRLIVERFGEDKLPPKLKEAWSKFKSDGKDCKFWLIYSLQPRRERDNRYADAMNQPVEEAWVLDDAGGPTLLEESGFWEMPVSVSRYLKDNSELGIYGYGPAWRAMASIANANFMSMLMTFLGEKAAIPPVLIPSNLEGNVDIRAGGMTFFKEGDATNIPREWGTQGRYDIGKDLLETFKDEIKKAFHTDLFTVISDLEREVTAYQVRALENEKLTRFAPAFTQQMSDDKQQHAAIFGILLRGGHFGEIPRRAVVEKNGQLEVPNPRPVYLSLLAQSLQYVETDATEQFIGQVAQLSAIRPDALNVINLSKALRLVGSNRGVPNDILTTEEEEAELNAAQAQAQQEQMMPEAADKMASAASKMGIKAV